MGNEHRPDQKLYTPRQEQEVCSDAPGMKLCQSSHHEGPRQTPATEEFFYRNRSKWDGWSSVCKTCWAKQKADIKKRQEDDQAKQAVKSVIKLARNRDNVPHMTELVEALYSRLDGVEGFADIFINDMLAATPGSPHRIRAGETLIHLTVKNTDSGHAQKPMELFTDEELEQYIQSNAGKVIDASRTLEIEHDDTEDEEYDEDSEPEEDGDGPPEDQSP